MHNLPSERESGIFNGIQRFPFLIPYSGNAVSITDLSIVMMEPWTNSSIGQWSILRPGGNKTDTNIENLQSFPYGLQGSCATACARPRTLTTRLISRVVQRRRTLV